MTENYPEPTGDEVWDGTRLPTPGVYDMSPEEGDAGVNDDGTEEWYGEGD